MIKVDIEEVGPCKKRLRVEVPREKIQEELDRSYKELTTTLTIPGFRRGKVPRRLLEKRFGKQVSEDVKDALMGRAFSEAVEENKLAPLGDPTYDKVEYDDGNRLAFEAEVSVKPTFELGEYAGIEVQKGSVEVTDEDVEGHMAEMRRRQGELVSKEGPAAKGDFLVADVAVEVEEASVLSREGATVLVGEDEVLGLSVPGIGEALEGVKVGESVRREVTLPDAFREEAHRGKTGTLVVLVHEVKALSIPPADDAWAKELDFDSLEELRVEVRRNLEVSAAAEAERALMDKLVDVLVDRIAFDLPEDIVEAETQKLLHRRLIRLRLAGVDPEEVVKQVDEARHASRDGVVRGLRAWFILDRIAEKERIYVTEEDVEARINEMAQRHRKWPNEVQAELEQGGLLTQLRAEIRDEKVRRMLLEKAKVTT